LWNIDKLFNFSVFVEKPLGERRLQQVKSVPIAVNGYELNLQMAMDPVYKYEIKFLGIKKDGKEKDLTRGPKNE